MTLDRRDFAKLFAGGALGSLVLPDSLLGLTHGPAVAARRGQEPFFQWRSVGAGVHVAMGQGGNVMVVADGGEALISDSKNLGYGFTLRREAEAVGGAPLRYAVNTHHHGDHVGGNAALTSDLPLLGHPNAQGRLRSWAAGQVGQASAGLARTIAQMKEQGGDPAVIAELERQQAELQTLNAERFVPTQAVASGEDVQVGSRTLQLRYVDRGHTDNDLFLYLPDLNVMHTGDLLFVGRHPFIDAGSGANTVGWQRCIEAMMQVANASTVVIPGHGDVTDRAGLQRQWDYFEGMRDAVMTAKAAGMTKEAVMELTPPVFEGLGGNGGRGLGVVYDEVSG
jgi:glyoxylase-like metal-dependent hydrolase (beta-lactamase superfamily II)